METKFNRFFNKKFTYAIVGASKKEEKYGYKIFKTLLDAGFKVIPINPRENEILGVKCYSSLIEIEEKIDVVDFVVPAGVTLKVLEEIIDNNLDIDKVWFQPNTFDSRCEKICYRNSIKYLKDFCLLKSVLKKL